MIYTWCKPTKKPSTDIDITSPPQIVIFLYQQRSHKKKSPHKSTQPPDTAQRTYRSACTLNPRYIQRYKETLNFLRRLLANTRVSIGPRYKSSLRVRTLRGLFFQCPRECPANFVHHNKKTRFSPGRAGPSHAGEANKKPNGTSLCVPDSGCSVAPRGFFSPRSPHSYRPEENHIYEPGSKV